MDSATSRGDPLLFYWWTPHSAFSKFDLTAFELPAYSDECYASGAVDCDYPDDVLFKIMWDGLEEGAPTAFTILSNFSYSNEDQIFMLGKLDEGLSVDEAAAAWMDATSPSGSPGSPDKPTCKTNDPSEAALRGGLTCMWGRGPGLRPLHELPGYGFPALSRYATLDLGLPN